MKIRARRGMAQRPVTVAAIDGIGRFDDRRKPKQKLPAPCKQRIRKNHGFQFHPAGEQAGSDLRLSLIHI